MILHTLRTQQLVPRVPVLTVRLWRPKRLLVLSRSWNASQTVWNVWRGLRKTIISEDGPSGNRGKKKWWRDEPPDPKFTAVAAWKARSKTSLPGPVWM